MNFTPKQRFQENKQYTEAHRELVVSDRFRAAAESALLHLVMDLSDCSDPATAAANWHRIEGARSYVRSIINLGEVGKALPEPPPQNLNHRT